MADGLFKQIYSDSSLVGTQWLCVLDRVMDRIPGASQCNMSLVWIGGQRIQAVQKLHGAQLEAYLIQDLRNTSQLHNIIVPMYLGFGFNSTKILGYSHFVEGYDAVQPTVDNLLRCKPEKVGCGMAALFYSGRFDNEGNQLLIEQSSNGQDLDFKFIDFEGCTDDKRAPQKLLPLYSALKEGFRKLGREHEFERGFIETLDALTDKNRNRARHNLVAEMFPDPSVRAGINPYLSVLRDRSDNLRRHFNLD